MPSTPRELPVLLHQGEDGFVVAECPVLPGCISQGETREAALRNIQEAIELYLEDDVDVPAKYDLVHVRIAS